MLLLQPSPAHDKSNFVSVTSHDHVGRSVGDGVVGLEVGIIVVGDSVGADVVGAVVGDVVGDTLGASVRGPQSLQSWPRLHLNRGPQSSQSMPNAHEA